MNVDLLVALHLRGGSTSRASFASLDVTASGDALEAAGLIYVGEDRVGLTSVGLWIATWVTGAPHPVGGSRPAEAR
jgi:hypothetical protein